MELFDVLQLGYWTYLRAKNGIEHNYCEIQKLSINFAIFLFRRVVVANKPRLVRGLMSIFK